MWIHCKGFVTKIGQFHLWDTLNNAPYPFELSDIDAFDGCYYSLEEQAYEAALDYHADQGLKAYLKLYPPPEKGEWDWISQNANGKWYGWQGVKPTLVIDKWVALCSSDYEWGLLQESPINPFWRKTLR